MQHHHTHHAQGGTTDLFPRETEGLSERVSPQVYRFSLKHYEAFFIEPLYWITFARTALYSLLVTAITAAIFVYFQLFDFSTHPGQLIYVGAYFLIGIPLTWTILKEGTGLPKT